MSTGQQSVRSGVVTVAGRAAQLVLQLGLAVTLQRILTEDDVGIQAYVFPIALLVQNIANGGLQSAIIQHATLDDVEASALFWASLRWNALLVTAMIPVMALLAQLNGDTRVVPVAAVWAAIIFGATLSAIPEALLKRDFRFGTVLVAHLVALVVSIVVAVVAARSGAGYWTWIIQMAVVEFGRAAIIWSVSGWRPLAPSRLGDARHQAVHELRTYWRGFAGFRFFGWVADQCDRLVVGATLGVATLGIYDTGKRWGTFAFVEPYTALTEVAVATLSRVRTDHARFTQYARNAFLPMLAVSLPILGFLFAEPVAVMRFLFPERWVASAPVLQWLALALAVGSIGRLVQWISLATGGEGPHRQLRWAMLTAPVFVAGTVVGVRWGILGVALGVTIAHAITSLPGVFVLLRRTPVRVRDILPVWLIPAAASAAGVVVLKVLPSLPSGGAGALFLRGVVFLGVYLLGWVLAPGGLPMLRAVRRSGTD